MRNLRHGFLSGVAAFAIMGAAAGPAWARQSAASLKTEPGPGDDLDRVVAVVGREAIFLSDLAAQVEFSAMSNRVDLATPGLREQVLDAMINEKLIVAQALNDTNVRVTEDDITAQLDELIAQRIKHPQIGSQQRLEEMYGMSVSRMKREFRDEMRKQLLSQRLQQMKFSSVTVSRREIEEFYNTFKDSLPVVGEELELNHIFRYPRAGVSAREALMNKARSILDSIKAGGDFADFARRYSDDAATASSGGDLGSWKRGEFVPEFEEVVFALQEGQLSDVVETSRGLHIVEVKERRGDRITARHILFKTGLDPESGAEAVDFLETLRDSALAGTPFIDLAKRHSDDKESGAMGGYLGRLPVDQFDQSIITAVDTLPAGSITKPVPVMTGSVKGFQIIWVKGRFPRHEMNLLDDYKRLEDLAGGYKRNTEYQKWLAELRGQIYWEVRL
jgi:peptidyl-prolyl cis-trans isomerase SurA